MSKIKLFCNDSELELIKDFITKFKLDHYKIELNLEPDSFDESFIITYKKEIKLQNTYELLELDQLNAKNLKVTLDLFLSSIQYRNLAKFVCHDIASPVSMIMSYSERLDDLYGKDKEKFYRFNEKIGKAGVKASKTIDLTRDYYKAHAIKSFNFTSINLNNTLNTLIKDDVEEFELEEIEDTLYHLPKIELEKYILYPLIQNALDHKTDNSKIFIEFKNGILKIQNESAKNTNSMNVEDFFSPLTNKSSKNDGPSMALPLVNLFCLKLGIKLELIIDKSFEVRLKF